MTPNQETIRQVKKLSKKLHVFRKSMATFHKSQDEEFNLWSFPQATFALGRLTIGTIGMRKLFNELHKNSPEFIQHLLASMPANDAATCIEGLFHANPDKPVLSRILPLDPIKRFSICHQVIQITRKTLQKSPERFLSHPLIGSARLEMALAAQRCESSKVIIPLLNSLQINQLEEKYKDTLPPCREGTPNTKTIIKQTKRAIAHFAEHCPEQMAEQALANQKILKELSEGNTDGSMNSVLSSFILSVFKDGIQKYISYIGTPVKENASRSLNRADFAFEIAKKLPQHHEAIDAHLQQSLLELYPHKHRDITLITHRCALEGHFEGATNIGRCMIKINKTKNAFSTLQIERNKLSSCWLQEPINEAQKASIATITQKERGFLKKFDIIPDEETNTEIQS